MKVRLSEFECGHIKLLAEWLASYHVAPWFPQPKNYMAWATRPPDEGRQYVVNVNSYPVGYVRWTYVSREVLDGIGFQDIPGNSADIDVLIGEMSMTGRGIAVKAIRLALEKIRFEDIATLAALTTSVDNLRAQKAFVQAGFVIDRIYNPDGFGKCYLMLHSIK